MGVNLQKGQRVDLTKGNAGLAKLVVGLGWDTNNYDGGEAFDLDAAAFLLAATGKVVKDTDFVFYNNLRHESGAVEHQGDNLTGQGEGDDEQIKIDLSRVPSGYQNIAFAVTIHDAASRKQNFGQVQNAFIRIVNEINGQELLRFDLGEDFSVETTVIFAELYLHAGEWKFNAIGNGFQGGLEALCQNYGIQV
jgi:tellurium resistance protein TerD